MLSEWERVASSTDSPIPACWQIRGSVRRRQSTSKERASRIFTPNRGPESNPPGRWASKQRPKEGPRETTPPAQWAAAADRGRGSTAACSTVSVADPGSRRSMDTLLYAVGLSASVQLRNSRLCPIAAAAARCRSLEPLGLGSQRPATARRHVLVVPHVQVFDFLGGRSGPGMAALHCKLHQPNFASAYSPSYMPPRERAAQSRCIGTSQQQSRGFCSIDR